MTMMPSPLQVRARIYCPESSIEGLRCPWGKRARKKALRKYRRHWLRRHAVQFTAETPWADPAYPHVLSDVRQAMPPGPGEYRIRRHG